MEVMKRHTEVCSIDLQGRAHSRDLGVDGRVILKWIFKRLDGKVWNGFIWLRIGTSGELL
jgi:hypothetical protein